MMTVIVLASENMIVYGCSQAIDRAMRRPLPWRVASLATTQYR